jgi:hypothetical protein
VQDLPIISVLRLPYWNRTWSAFAVIVGLLFCIATGLFMRKEMPEKLNGIEYGVLFAKITMDLLNHSSSLNVLCIQSTKNGRFVLREQGGEDAEENS